MNIKEKVKTDKKKKKWKIIPKYKIRRVQVTKIVIFIELFHILTIDLDLIQR